MRALESFSWRTVQEIGFNGDGTISIHLKSGAVSTFTGSILLRKSNEGDVTVFDSTLEAIPSAAVPGSKSADEIATLERAALVIATENSQSSPDAKKETAAQTATKPEPKPWKK